LEREHAPKSKLSVRVALIGTSAAKSIVTSFKTWFV
jgi:hypothetical protein